MTEMNDGFQLLPVLIGLFAVSQIGRDILNIEQQADPIELGRESVLLRVSDVIKHGVNLVRSSVIGTWIGILPGIGANIGSVTAYSVAKSFSKEPEKFGTGHEEGVVAVRSRQQCDDRRCLDSVDRDGSARQRDRSSIAWRTW